MYSRKAFKREARQLMRSSRPRYMVVALVYYLLSVGLTYVVTYLTDVGGALTGVLSLFLSILVSLFAMVMAVGFANYALRLMRGEDGGMGSLFAPFSYAGRSIGTTLLVGVFIFLWGLLIGVGAAVVITAAGVALVLAELPIVALVLGLALYIAAIVLVVIVALRYAMASFALAENPDAGVMNAVRRSVRMMRGYKGKLFVLDLSFIGWGFLVGLIAAAVMGIGVAVMGADWIMSIMGAVEDDPLAAYSLTERLMDRLLLWMLLAEVLALPLNLWLMTYRMCAHARFFNYVGGYDYHLYMTAQAGQNPQPPLAPPAQAGQAGQPSAGGYYTPAPPPLEQPQPPQPEQPRTPGAGYYTPAPPPEPPAEGQAAESAAGQPPVEQPPAEDPSAEEPPAGQLPAGENE